AYFVEHPRPQCYIRELPVRVHTKFVEQHAGILRELLEFLLPPEAIQPDAKTFTQRFGSSSYSYRKTSSGRTRTAPHATSAATTIASPAEPRMSASEMIGLTSRGALKTNWPRSEVVRVTSSIAMSDPVTPTIPFSNKTSLSRERLL